MSTRQCQKYACVGNSDGLCAVETCQGPIKHIRDPRKPPSPPDKAAEHYQTMRSMFDYMIALDEKRKKELRES